jgi:hypothetical protein
MIELFAIVVLFFFLKKWLNQKGRGMALAFIAPVFWIGGELIGIIFAAVIWFTITGEPRVAFVPMYVIGLLGAFVGAIAATLIVYLVPGNFLHCPVCKNPFVPPKSRGSVRQVCRRCRNKLRITGSRVELIEKKESRQKPDAGEDD